jgi:beta-lactamase regulating signal transducer with metallopeptidase domain
MMLTVGLVIELAWKSLLVAGITLGALRLTINRSPAERSWIAHIGLVALVLLAPIALLVPAWNPLPTPVTMPFAEGVMEAPIAHVAASAPAAAVAPTAAQAAQAEAWTLPSTGDLALWLYLLPAALLVLAMLVALVRLSAMHRRANVLVEAPWLAALAQAQKRMGFKHGTALLVSEELRSPVSWGVVRPIILLNPDAVSASREAEAIIAHELAHVARLDWAKLLIARIACALFWFNPFVWMLSREAHQLREEAADDAVLLSDVPDTDYASLLVNAARHDNKALLMAAHGVAPAKNSLHRRITRVLDGGLERRPAGGAWAVLCVVALFVVAAPLAALDPTARSEAAEDVDYDYDYDAEPQGLGGIVASAVQNAVSSVIGGGMVDVSELGDHDVDVDVNVDDEPKSEADRLIEMKAVGMTPDYIAQLRQAGFSETDMDDFVEARAVGVTPEFAREMRRYDPSVDLSDVVEARAVGVSPSFIGGMKQFFPGLQLDDAVELAALGVTTDFVREMKGLFPNLTSDQAVDMKAVGVTPEFVRQMRRQGISTKTPDDAVEGRLFVSASSATRGTPATTAVAIGPGGRNVTVRTPDGTKVKVRNLENVRPVDPPEPPVPPVPVQ